MQYIYTAKEFKDFKNNPNREIIKHDQAETVMGLATQMEEFNEGVGRDARIEVLFLDYKRERIPAQILLCKELREGKYVEYTIYIVLNSVL